MAQRQWTPEQSNAINARGGTLLLSAAAGSGKTAVLVERIIKLLTDENEPCEPSGLLVVTFTNAAAAEMRARINASVDELIKKEPANGFYRSIKMKLPEAKITTMDSFCISLVRENFHLANIEPDFRILDNSEQQILISEAVNTMLETLCETQPETYNTLNTITSYYGNDDSLAKKILNLYNFSLSHPFPQKWLEGVKKMYTEADDIKSSVWGKIIISEVLITIEYCTNLVNSAIKQIEIDEVISELYGSVFFDLQNELSNTYESLKNDEWDEIYSRITSVKFEALPKVPRGYGDNPAKVFAKEQYEKIKKLITGCSNAVCTDTAGHKEDSATLLPVINGLIWAVNEFKNNYDNLKKQRNSYTFTDIMHFALALLVKDKNGEIQKTSLAYDLQQNFREILIDEYQDTNEAQDMLFKMLSRNETNMFMVGDVKQSIYRFRLAMPEIFVDKSRKYCDFDEKNYPAKIILGKNFRSRKGVLDNINFLFKNIMSDYVGEMEYTDRDALYFGGGYDQDCEPCAEIKLLTSADNNEQAAYIADLIKEMTKNGTTVQDKNGKRPANYSDFCILLRSTSGKSDIYENALKQRDIPVSCEKKTSLFDSTETGVFISLLKIINNPTDDIAMISVMFSPLYGFTPDETAQIKLKNKNANMFTCLKNINNMPKAEKLIKDLTEFRKLAAIMPIEEFVQNLLDLTSYIAIATALESGAARRINLLMLCTLAEDFANSGGIGLGGFLRYLAKITENSAAVAAGTDASSSNESVKIMSIHKSKGLEFPFVILADCSKPFNTSDTTAEMIINPGTGIGIKISNSEKLQSYPTIAYAASKLAVKRASISEEMRVLYVALTRAKEKFIAVGSVSEPQKYLLEAEQAIADGKPSPGAVLNATSYMKWLLMGFLRHPDMNGVLNCTPSCGYDFKNAESSLSVEIVAHETNDPIAKEKIASCESDEAIIAQIKEKAEYVYPYIMPPAAKPKRTASDFEEKKFSKEYFAKSKPSFIFDEQLTPAQIGTANHIFLQNLDFNNLDMDSQIASMKAKGILNEKQCAVIRTENVKNFMQSELFKRIQNADCVLKEKEFTVQINLCDIVPTANENVKNEKVLILGKTDLVFTENGKAVVVDYKTDRTKTAEQFIEAYQGQLNMYRLAIEQLLEMPVKETLIYSLHLGKVIKIF